MPTTFIIAVLFAFSMFIYSGSLSADEIDDCQNIESPEKNDGRLSTPYRQ